MPTINKGSRSRFLRAPSTINPMLHTKNPSSNHIRREFRSALQFPDSPSIHEDANDVAEVREIAMTAASASPFAQSGTTQPRLVSRQSNHVCATTNAITITTNSATRPPKYQNYAPRPSNPPSLRPQTNAARAANCNFSNPARCSSRLCASGFCGRIFVCRLRHVCGRNLPTKSGTFRAPL